MEGHKEFVQIDHNELFPYLLVNVGSGVSMIKVYLLSTLVFCTAELKYDKKLFDYYLCF